MDGVHPVTTWAFLLLSLSLPVIDCSSFCGKVSLYSWYSYEECEWGCCNEYTSSPCCPKPSISFNLGAIIGGVIGAIAGLVVIVTIVVVLISVCCKTTRVVNPIPVYYNTRSAQIIGTGNMGPGYYSANVSYGLPPRPPPYSPPGESYPPYFPPEPFPLGATSLQGSQAPRSPSSPKAGGQQ